MKRATVLGLFVTLFALKNTQSVDFNSTVEEIEGRCPADMTVEIFKDDIVEEHLYAALWITIVLASVFLNGLIIHVIRVNPHMRTTTNYHIANMALGDILASLTTSFGTLHIVYSGYEWRGNKVVGEYFFCKTGCPLYHIFMFCSIYSLVAITFDRFLAISYPLKYHYNSSWKKYTIPGIWIASFMVPAHFVMTKVLFCERDGKFYCIPMKSQVDAYFIVVFGFGLSHLLIIILYALIAYKLFIRKIPGEHVSAQKTAAQKTSKRVNCMILFILLAFEISWTPMFIGYVFPALVNGEGKYKNFNLFFACRLLMVFNGISNFFIYAKFNENFRKAFKQTLNWKYITKK